MPEEQVTTPQAAEPAQAATPTPEPKAEQPKPDTDWQAAYKGLQTVVNKLHARDETVARDKAEVAEALRAIRETQSLIARQTLGPEQAGRLEQQQRYQAERVAALNAAQTTEAAVGAYATVLVDALKAVGANPDDPDIDWARDTRSVQEWQARVSQSVKTKIEKTIAEQIRKSEEGIKAKTAAEIKAESEALAARAVKEAGVDKVDSGKSGMASGGKSIAEMNDAEYAVFSEQKRQEREKRRMQTLR